mmetsp:Transcript_823/g.1881  ORF Transcript_823/g.1881 Transcript_823/m.1881 type:complete len:278 (-) Transcript_823:1141-1974(-)
MRSSSLVSSFGSFLYTVLVCCWLTLALALALASTTMILSDVHGSGVLVDSFSWTSTTQTRTRSRARSMKSTSATTNVQTRSGIVAAPTTIVLRGRADETEIGGGSTTLPIDYQSDSPTFGRGENHLSALVCEGDTVVYRTGSWYVDGVLVGEEDATPAYELCRVETIQIVWTHNCEHGVLRGLAIDTDTIDSGGNGDDNNPNNDNDDQPKKPAILSLREPLEDVEFGPEQLIARIRCVEWQKSNAHDDDDEGERGTCSIPLHESMWKENDCNTVMDE